MMIDDGYLLYQIPDIKLDVSNYPRLDAVRLRELKRNWTTFRVPEISLSLLF